MTTEKWEPAWKRRLSEQPAVNAPRTIVYSGEKPRRKGFVAAILGFFFLAAMTVTPVLATQGADHKVGLCHRTASDTNPYVFIEVDVASLPAHLNNLPGHPAKTNADGSPRNDYLADDASQCQTAEPTATPTPTPEPTSTPTPTDTPVATPTPDNGDTGGGATEKPRVAPLPRTDTADTVASVSGHPTAWVLFMALVVGLAYGALAVKDRLRRGR